MFFILPVDLVALGKAFWIVIGSTELLPNGGHVFELQRMKVKG